MIHILLVEDSPTDARLLRQIFVRADKEEWQMTHVERLSEAISISLQSSTILPDDSQAESVKQRRFDVVLLDLSLPDSTGLDTLKEYQAEIPDIPVVVLTGLDDEQLALQALAEGAQDYLVKDQITMQLLVRTARYAIERGDILNKLRETEERSRQALAKEQELNELKSNFVAMVSHEFRNPMTTIRTALEIIEHNNAALTEEQRTKYFERVQNAIKQMLQLLDEILFLSKTEAAKLEYNPIPVHLENFCSEIADIFQMRIGTQHTISFTAQGECNRVQMDEDLLTCILTNLLSNAIKYSPQQSNIKFDLNCKNGTATFQVQDQGVGIPLKDQSNLFQTFYRASNVGRIQGTGLGLAIVKRCVDLHGGEIQIESQQNVGTTVTVTLPLHFV
ncbi:hybrid sensor histidine kinase/response regulator [Nostocaceae cyanobacterium CENA357]|uniref:histidine kinase n=1 Tax=Atlanticothrix silvestris CENA357 TaxID=1725252 RepID=A0A8J7HPA7_9CYAN|nr:hybrid sensor histidine kinase/response regulator [Atlanticothrix silvestris]MBH8556065.1 hybrid sensor histidine kinase/response regulator [Atlanticothrix silvestris CENA357]